MRVGVPFGDPRRGLLAGGLEHPRADLDDQPALLGERDELGRRDEPARRVLPAQQRLGRGDLAGVEVEDRLVDEEQLVAGDRAAQVVLEREPVVRGDVHLVAELGVAVAAGALGLVERDVGVAQQVLGRLAVAGGDADRWS